MKAKLQKKNLVQNLLDYNPMDKWNILDQDQPLMLPQCGVELGEWSVQCQDHQSSQRHSPGPRVDCKLHWFIPGEAQPRSWVIFIQIFQIQILIYKARLCVRPFVPLWPPKVLFLLNFAHYIMLSMIFLHCKNKVNLDPT